MTDAAPSSVAITLNVAPALEDRVVDWLLDRDSVTGFTSYRAYGHGARHDDLSVAEQVSGRQRRIEFRVELAASALDAFVEGLYERFAGSDLYYLLTPVLRSGHLREITQ